MQTPPVAAIYRSEMCGIVGLWCASPTAESSALRQLERMSDTLTHRGPDGSGAFFDTNSGLGFGHRRLSILDLSENGRQPMWSQSGRYAITYNGEVYNAPEIRAELDRAGSRRAWRGHSDTEVVLEAIDCWGLEAAVLRFHGMFAFGLWDTSTRRLFLVRDRLGIKPLLYVTGGFGVAFGSELRSLQRVEGFRPRLDRAVVASFLRYGVVPDDECIVEGVRKVQPGCIVEFDGPASPGMTRSYWSAREAASEGLHRPFEGDEHEAIDELERRIRSSVAMRMRSDVAFGAFLSGGIDSSTVVAMMQVVAQVPVRTFCIGNTLQGYDESKYAEAVARHLHCDHQTLIAEPSDMLAVVPDVAQFWDEPFADSSQIPTLLVSRLARTHVTVALSGDGGDELFAGYNRHAWAPKLWNVASRFPAGARRALGALQMVKTERWDRAFRAVGLGNAVRLPGDKLHKIAALAEVGTAHEFYERLRSQWPNPERLLRQPIGDRAPAADDHLQASFAEQMMFHDLTHYLRDDILTKVDRASMAASLEARVPLLDHGVVEFAWSLPFKWKVRGGTQKWILRQVLDRHVPSELFDRAKTGFGVPIGDWLRGPLQPWASDLLAPERLAADGIFDEATVSRTWSEHLEGRGNHDHRLWAVLMFQSWWERNRQHVEA